MVNRSNAILREERPLFVREPFSGADFSPGFGIGDARKTQILESIV